MKGHHCCNADTGPNYSYAGALGVLALGYLSNIFASMISHVSLNLLYWWVTAFLVFASFQISPGRFFRLDQVVKGSFFVPVAVLLACFLPLQLFPQLVQYFLWRVTVGYIVSAGFWLTMMQLYQFKQPFRVALWGEGHIMWLGSGLMVAIASMRSPALLLCTLTGLVLAQVRQMIYEVIHREGKSQLNLAGSLTLAMGMSWGYSFIRLAAASWSMSAMHSLFFCDCWKTMGVVMLADKMRFRVNQSSTSGDQTDGVLGHMIPLVLGVGYAASVFWAVALPALGWGLPMRVFATVLVSACPCVITLAAPLVDFFESKLVRVFDKAWPNGDGLRDQCLQQNLLIVRVYYLLSIFLSSGGSYWLAGVWMSPWTAGLLMMAGQGVLVVHTSTYMLNVYAQVSKQSAWALLYHLYRRSVDGRLLAAPTAVIKPRHVPSGQIDSSRGNNSAGKSKSNGRSTSCCASKSKGHQQPVPVVDALVSSREVEEVSHRSPVDLGNVTGAAIKHSPDDVFSSGVRGPNLFDYEASRKVQNDNVELAEGKVSKKSGVGGSEKSSKPLRGTSYKSKRTWRGKGKKSKDSSTQLREADPQAFSAGRK